MERCGAVVMQTFGIVDNGKVRDMTPEEIEELSAIEEGAADD